MLKQLFIIIFFLLSMISQAQTTDEQGRKQGYWKKKDTKTDKLLYEGLFKDDKPMGVIKYYGINDSVKAKMNFVKEGKVAYATLYHLTGKLMAIGKYITEIKDSIWHYYDENGILISQENFINGKKEGKSFVYFPDGTISEEYLFKNGLKEGAFKQYFDKTHIRGEGTYVKGELEGKNAYYYPNGNTAAIGFYSNGYKKGPWLYRDANGKLKEKEWYKEKGELATEKEAEAFFAKAKVNIEEKKIKEPLEKKVTKGKKTISKK